MITGLPGPFGQSTRKRMAWLVRLDCMLLPTHTLIPEEEYIIRSSPRGRARHRRRLSIRLLTISALSVVLPAVTLAQGQRATSAEATDLLSGPSFILAVIAGLVLAASFQLILTSLSLVVGLNSPEQMGGERPKAKHSEGAERAAFRCREKDLRKHNKAMDKAPVYGSGHNVSSARGVWTLITASIALFAATWMAVRLTSAHNATTGAVLGLVIWGLFYVLMKVVEASEVSSLVGSLMIAARSGNSARPNAWRWVIGSAAISGIAAVAGGLVATVAAQGM